MCFIRNTSLIMVEYICWWNFNFFPLYVPLVTSRNQPKRNFFPYVGYLSKSSLVTWILWTEWILAREWALSSKGCIFDGYNLFESIRVASHIVKSQVWNLLSPKKKLWLKMDVDFLGFDMFRAWASLFCIVQ